MKRFLLLILICNLLFIGSSVADEPPIITFEQVKSGEYYGETVRMNAIAIEITPYYNLRYLWAIERSDGEFEIVDNSESRWSITEEEYEHASSKVKAAIDNQEPFLLTVNLSNKGLPLVQSYSLVNNEVLFDFEEYVAPCLVGLGIISIMMIIAKIIDTSIQVKKHRLDDERERVVKTKFVDSSHTSTITSQTSLGSAIGRAVVGGMVAGTLGSVVGASTAKQKHTTHEKHSTTFMVYYKNGCNVVKTVDNSSAEYKLYMEKLEI